MKKIIVISIILVLILNSTIPCFFKEEAFFFNVDNGYEIRVKSLFIFYNLEKRKGMSFDYIKNFQNKNLNRYVLYNNKYIFPSPCYKGGFLLEKIRNFFILLNLDTHNQNPNQLKEIVDAYDGKFYSEEKIINGPFYYNIIMMDF